MQYADFEYYKNEFHGIVIKSGEEYVPFAERAGDELALFVDRLPKNAEAQTALKRCACRIAEVMCDDFKSSKNGQRLNSESVSGYYSASYGSKADVNGVSATRQAVNTAIMLYIGKYINGKPVIITY